MITEAHPEFDAEGPKEQAAELPRYRCHKEVWALKIADIKPKDDTRVAIADLEAALNSGSIPTIEPDGSVRGVARPAVIVPADSRYAPFEVDGAYMWKHRPEVGGYYVVYKDGYKSYSPAQAFEEGYTKI